MFSLIVAVGENNEIGKNNQLLWHIPEDLKNFKKITMGKTVIMGKNTYKSIGKPLPNRKNIVLSRNPLEIEEKIKEDRKKYENENTKLELCDNLQKIIGKYKNSEEEIFIIGGGEIYKKAFEMKIVKRIYMSHVNFSDKNADTYFPKIDLKKWVVITKKIMMAGDFVFMKKLVDKTDENLKRRKRCLSLSLQKKWWLKLDMS